MRMRAAGALLPLLVFPTAVLAADDRQPPVQPADVAALFDERGVLTPRRQLTLDASFSYSHSSTTEVAMEGYTVLPAVLVGLFNVSELQRDTFTASVSARYGITNRLEVELRVPWVYRQEQVQERQFAEADSREILRDSDGFGLGDIELSLRYQLNRAIGNGPFYVAGLRIKPPTGEGPFDVDRERRDVEVGDVVIPLEVLTEQPTGSGFWGIQPSLGIIYVSDPAVLYGNINYLWNIKEDNGPPFYTINPGDAVGLSFGMGFAINGRTSFSLGYDHSRVSETTYEVPAGAASFDYFQVGTVLIGFSHRLSATRSAGLSLGIGVTEYAPNVQLTFRIPLLVL